MDMVFMCLEWRGFSGSAGPTRSRQTFDIPFTWVNETPILIIFA